MAASALACGGRDGPAAYRARDAPASCMEMLEAAPRDRCLAGQGDACVDAVLHMAGGVISFGSSVRVAFPEIESDRERCAIAFLHHGCTLQSGQSCLFLGGVLSSLGHHAESIDASSKACALGHADGCWYAADIDRSAGDWPVPDARQRALAEKACDLGSADGCMGVASLTLFGRRIPASDIADAVRRRGGDVRLGLAYWERACVHAPIRRPCWSLHAYLKDPGAPRAREDQWLLLGSLAPDAPAEEVAKRAAFHARGAELLGKLDRACATQGDLAACWKLVELESLDYGSPASFDPPSAPPRALPDVVNGPFDLCARGVAEACLATTWSGRFVDKETRLPHRLGGIPELTRGCDLGSGLACANAAYRMRGDPRAPALFARACAGGVRWACDER